MKLRKIAVAMALCVVMTACGTGAGETVPGQDTVSDVTVSNAGSAEDNGSAQNVTDAADTGNDAQNGTDESQNGTVQPHRNLHLSLTPEPRPLTAIP